MQTQDTTLAQLPARQRKAAELAKAGAVSLLPGRKWAVVKGSGKASYKVNRDGRECQDWLKRGEQTGACQHMLRVAALCDLPRQCRAEVKATGRCRRPAGLARALANGTADKGSPAGHANPLGYPKLARAKRLAELDAELFGTAN